jgi:hypothetical protein
MGKLGNISGRDLDLHRAREAGICYVITVYEPDPARWQPGFRKRRVP